MSSESPDPPANDDPINPRFPWVVWVSLVVGLAIVLPVEYRRLEESLQSKAGGIGWLTSINPDTTPYFFAFLLLPLAWCLRTRRRPKKLATRKLSATWFGANTKPGEQTSGADRVRAFVLASFVAAISWGMSYHYGSTPVTIKRPLVRYRTTLSELPPAFHDEYSYLFQAKTFLHGKLAYSSSEDCPALFDQMHVLNDNGIYAGRYFPGTAIWMMPFVAMEKPHWGHWLAGALSAAFVFLIGRELAGNAVGFLAGLFTALSPGIMTFGQLLLAHQPTLVGLTFFAWMFFRMMRTRSCWNASLAGFGLIFAALCRPMTAAGIGLPFGVWLLYWWLRGSNPTSDDLHSPWNLKRRTLLVASMGLPICLGIGGMLIYDYQLTGNMFVTPYQLYTDIYTPKHIYGFNNVERAKANNSGKVIENYDRWAENLTPSLATRNVRDRLIASGQWVLGLVPLAMSVCVFPFLAGRRKSAPLLSDFRWWLIFLAAISLHAAHIPYWYAGIRNWHYVFEAAPFFLLMHAGVTGYFLRQWWQLGSRGVCVWWTSLTLIALVVAYSPLPFESHRPRVRAALQEDIWARRNYQAFNLMLDHIVTDRPALVLVAENPADRHIDYVTNNPTLDDPVIRGRFRPELYPLETVFTSFSNRAVYAVILDPTILKSIERGRYAGVRFQFLAEEPLVSGNAFIYRLSLDIAKKR